MILIKVVPVTIRVLYWMPLHRLLLQEFLWSTDDRLPDLPRIQSFLRHWHREIDATINEVSLAVGDQRDWRPIDVDRFI
jgi:uncharacterized protein Usg